MTIYTNALAKGTDLSESEKKDVAEKLHEYTGLPVAYLLKADLRVSGGQFEKALQDDDDLTTGRLDTRYSGPSIDSLSESAEYDPQSSAISSAYVTIFNEYVRHDLKYGEGQTYLERAQFTGHRWNWSMRGRSQNNVSEYLAEAMKMNPRLKVMVYGGYYDLATPYFAAQYEDKHLPISSKLAKNIEYGWFESGHMVYVKEECLKLLHDRTAAFIKETLSEKVKALENYQGVLDRIQVLPLSICGYSSQHETQRLCGCLCDGFAAPLRARRSEFCNSLS